MTTLKAGELAAEHIGRRIALIHPTLGSTNGILLAYRVDRAGVALTIKEAAPAQEADFDLHFESPFEHPAPALPLPPVQPDQEVALGHLVIDETLLPIQGQQLKKIENLEGYAAITTEHDTDDVLKATVITSKVGPRTEGTDAPWQREEHKIMLDLDLPAQLIPSSTPGHSHLYIDFAITWEKYAALLLALGTAGILEEGYVNASLARGFTCLRLPWIKKAHQEPKAKVNTKPPGRRTFVPNAPGNAAINPHYTSQQLPF